MPLWIETNFDQLIADLRATGKDIDRGVSRGLSTAGRDGERFARRSAIERSNSKGKSDSRGTLASQFKKNSSYRTTDTNAVLTFNDRMNRSLATYAKGQKSPTADYRGKGVLVDHFGERRFFTRRSAFIRTANGGRFMAERSGHRDIGQVYYAKPLSQAAIDPETAEPTMDLMADKLFSAVDRAFKRR